ncbi:Na+/H+ antiporter [Rhodococcus sp. NPDC058521]|uniref:Na+/H+ antiporter n=1 Tax=Rhodococcus sp. NPDC058521 TaxID=3346536 RepID=UPI0036528E6A
MNGILILLVVIAAVAVSGLARRKNLQPALVLVTIGGLASFIPGMPRLELDPDIILGVVLPPLLYSAASRFSVATFRRHLVPILRLGVLMVLVVAFAVAGLVQWMIPEFTFATALVLGAVVAPTDAVSAVSVGQKLGLPRRVTSILTGEGLVNDATALTLFSVAVSAAAGTTLTIRSPILFFLYEVIGGVGIGLLLAVVVRWMRARLEDAVLETVLGFTLPFAAYLAAEQIHASGVLAVVAAGFLLGHKATDVSVATRLQERAVWASTEKILEMFVFAYMGLQLSFVLDDVVGPQRTVIHAFAYACVVLALVIAVRPLWVMLNWARHRAGVIVVRAKQPDRPLNWQESTVVSWAGMRGVVTLAAAGGVPFVTADGNPLAGRDIIQVVAFVVAVGTLLLQGATMPYLIRRLKMSDPDDEARLETEFASARRIAQEAGDDALSGYLEKRLRDREARGIAGDDESAKLRALVERVHRSMQARYRAQEAEDGEVADGSSFEDRRDAVREVDGIRRATLGAQRKALIAARDAGDLDDEVLRSVLEGLDIEEAAAEERLRRGPL